MPSGYAPIAVFVYRRPERARRLIASLLENPEAKDSELIIYSDGAKSPDAENDVREMRDLMRAETGFGSITLVERERNLGLANSIIDGVSTQCRLRGRVVVLEEDLVVSPHFLAFMNDALVHYQTDERVMQVVGHLFPFDLTATEDAVFLPLTSSWGWATWDRAWCNFDPEAKGYETLQNDAALRREFDCGGWAPYFGMLQDQLKGRVDSWAIKWYLSVFLRKGLVLYPRKNMVVHEGWDEKATHAKKDGGDSPDSYDPMFRVETFPMPQLAAQNVGAVVAFFRMRCARAKIDARKVRHVGGLMDHIKRVASGIRRGR